MPKFQTGNKVVRIHSDTANTVWEEVCKEVGVNPYGVFTVAAHTIGFSLTIIELGTYCWSPVYFQLADPLAAVPLPPAPVTTTRDNAAVDKPQHYQFFPDLEAIEVIARSMTLEQFYGYTLGNALKYRLRAGAKDDLQQDIAKAKKYKEIYEQFKHLCHSGNTQA